MIETSTQQTITLIDAYDAMRHFLEAYWERGDRASDDLAVLLGSLNREEASQSLPLDAAMWDDWLTAISHTRNTRS